MHEVLKKAETNTTSNISFGFNKGKTIWKEKNIIKETKAEDTAQQKMIPRTYSEIKLLFGKG